MTRRREAAGKAAAALLWGVASAGLPIMAHGEDAGAPVLAKAAVDTTLYRDGEVRRTNQMHGRWSLDCDEVVRLHQRYCSLRSLAVDPVGTAVARVTISTDDRGQPAALLDLPLSLDLNQPVAVTAGQALVVGSPSKSLLADVHRLAAKPSGAGKARNQIGTSLLSATLFPAVCDSTGCHAVWSLSPADIGALRAGAGLRLHYALATPTSDAFATRIIGTTRIVEAIVSSDGLNEAITASLR